MRKLHPDLQRSRDEAKAVLLIVSVVFGGTFAISWGLEAIGWAWRAFTQ